MKISRGLAALILTIFFQTTLVAEYLYKDEVVSSPQFTDQINTLGTELYQKTGISLRLVMLRELPNGTSVVDYEKELMKNFDEPTILLTFAELNSKVDIYANDKSLYEYFDRKQVLSPVASMVQAFMMALFYSESFDAFLVNVGSYGGTILPLLAQKAEDGQQVGKYSGSMYNGYVDIAEQIADSKGVILDNAAGNMNKDTIFYIKLFFYGFIIYAIFRYIRTKIKMRRQELETK